MTSNFDDVYVAPNETLVKNEIQTVSQSKWAESTAMDAAWTTLFLTFQIFVPFGMLALVWGRKEVLCKFLHQFESSRVAGFCPSFTKRDRLLKWVGTMLHFSGSICNFWKDGSLLCTLINSAIPGACSNPYRHWRRPPIHGQALAFKYLNITPVFTEIDFQTKKPTQYQLSLLVDYLLTVQHEISKICAKDFEEIQYTSTFLARGMGLITGERYRKAIFYVYPNSSNKKNKQGGEVFITLKGPYNTYGKARLSFEGPKSTKNFVRRGSIFEECKKLAMKTTAQSAFFKTISLDFTYFNKLTDTAGEIKFKINMEQERAKVLFIPNHTGVYELCLISDGQHLRGSPFNIQIMENTTGILDNMETLEDKVVKRSRTIVRKIKSRVIDFVTEKMNYEDYQKSIKEPAMKVLVDTITKNKTDYCNNNIACDPDAKIMDSGLKENNPTAIKAFEINENSLKNLELIKKGKLLDESNDPIESEPELTNKQHVESNILIEIEETVTLSSKFENKMEVSCSEQKKPLSKFSVCNFDFASNPNFTKLSVQDRKRLIENNFKISENKHLNDINPKLHKSVKERKEIYQRKFQSMELSPYALENKFNSEKERKISLTNTDFSRSDNFIVHLENSSKNVEKNAPTPDLVTCHVEIQNSKNRNPDFITNVSKITDAYNKTNSSKDKKDFRRVRTELVPLEIAPPQTSPILDVENIVQEVSKEVGPNIASCRNNSMQSESLENKFNKTSHNPQNEDFEEVEKKQHHVLKREYFVDSPERMNSLPFSDSRNILKDSSNNNIVGSSNFDYNVSENLSILQLLDCLKTSDAKTKTKSHQKVCLTLSMPNLNNEKPTKKSNKEPLEKTTSLLNVRELSPVKEMFKNRRDFWDSYCTTNSSLNSTRSISSFAKSELSCALKTGSTCGLRRDSTPALKTESMCNLTFEYCKKKNLKFYKEKYKTNSCHQTFPSIREKQNVFGSKVALSNDVVTSDVKNSKKPSVSVMKPKIAPKENEHVKFNNKERVKDKIKNFGVQECYNSVQHIKQNAKNKSKEDLSKEMKNNFKKAKEFFTTLEKKSESQNLDHIDNSVSRLKLNSLKNLVANDFNTLELDMNSVDLKYVDFKDVAVDLKEINVKTVNFKNVDSKILEKTQKTAPSPSKRIKLRKYSKDEIKKIRRRKRKLILRNFYKDILGEQKCNYKSNSYRVVFKGRPYQRTIAKALNSIPIETLDDKNKENIIAGKLLKSLDFSLFDSGGRKNNIHEESILKMKKPTYEILY